MLSDGAALCAKAGVLAATSSPATIALAAVMRSVRARRECGFWAVIWWVPLGYLAVMSAGFPDLFGQFIESGVISE